MCAPPSRTVSNFPPRTPKAFASGAFGKPNSECFREREPSRARDLLSELFRASCPPIGRTRPVASFGFPAFTLDGLRRGERVCVRTGEGSDAGFRDGLRMVPAISNRELILFSGRRARRWQWDRGRRPCAEGSRHWIFRRQRSFGARWRHRDRRRGGSFLLNHKGGSVLE